MNETRDKMYYVVIALHPTEPSSDDRSRGRKRHLSISKEPGTKTVCNLLVEHVVPQYKQGGGKWYDTWINNGLCKTCLREFLPDNEK